MAYNAAMAARERLLRECVYVPGKGMVPESELTIEDYGALLADMRKRPGATKAVADLEAKIAELAEAAEIEAEDLEDDLIERAIRAYSTRERKAGYIVQQPSSSSYTYQSSVFDDAWDGDRRTYIVLENVNGVLAVYRTKYDGHIEYVAPDHWPAWLAGEHDLANA